MCLSAARNQVVALSILITASNTFHMVQVHRPCSHPSFLSASPKHVDFLKKFSNFLNFVEPCPWTAQKGEDQAQTLEVPPRADRQHHASHAPLLLSVFLTLPRASLVRGAKLRTFNQEKLLLKLPRLKDPNDSTSNVAQLVKQTSRQQDPRNCVFPNIFPNML
jgi:hypothetical protein